MKNTFLVSILVIGCIALMAGKCSAGSDQNSQYLFAAWKHSYEEDEEGLSVFRTIDYTFPPSRGRRGFTISSNGTFVDQPIAAADGNDNIKGRWVHKKGDLEVMLDNGRFYSVEIVLLEKGLMKVRKK